MKAKVTLKFDIETDDYYLTKPTKESAKEQQSVHCGKKGSVMRPCFRRSGSS